MRAWNMERNQPIYSDIGIKNMEIICKVPIYPEKNFLDLGLWMKIQSYVLKLHCRRLCTYAALAKSVSDAWNKSLLVKTFKNSHGQ